MADSSISQISKLNVAQHANFNQSIQGTQDANNALESMLNANKMEASQEKLLVEAQENSAMGIMIRTQKLAVRRQDVKTEKARNAQQSVLVRKEDADGLADQFSQRQGNKEYHLDPLLLSLLAVEELGTGINENSEPDEIIAIVRRRMTVNGQSPDVSIVDKALEFLLETTRHLMNTSTEAEKAILTTIADKAEIARLKTIADKIELAKNIHFEANSVEIQVAQKIIGAVDAMVEKTGETVKETLNHYRDVVHNPPDLQTLRKFYEPKGYKFMILELKGLNSFLGGNLKKANLENPEISQLAAAARKMQALLGVFRQSKAHIPTMESYLDLNGILAA